MRRLVPPRSTPIEKLTIGFRPFRVTLRICDFQIRPRRDSRPRLSGRAKLGSFLATRTVVAATSGNHDALDRGAADHAGLAFTPIHPMLQLERTLVAICIDIVGDRRPPEREGLLQDFLKRHRQPPELFPWQGW